MSKINWTNERRKLSDLHPWEINPRQIKEKQAKRLAQSFDEFGQVDVLAVGPDGEVYNGHQRLNVLLAEHGADYEVDVRVSSRALSEGERKKLTVFLHQGATGEWDFDLLANNFEIDDLLDWGFDKADLDIDLWMPDDTEQEARQTLAERFIVPPFSVLDARQGYWQDRKRAWLALGLKPELGRMIDGNNAIGSLNKRITPQSETYYKSNIDPRSYSNDDWSSYGGPNMRTGTSLFDPVLCECAYRWFCPPNGLIINPTAGESSYGIVAGYLGYKYKGVELRIEQIEANRQQATDIGVVVEWIHGDGVDVFDLVGEDADFIMCCPPYGDLEVYSDDPADLSTMEYNDFLVTYQQIISESVRRLKNNRFACFTVGDFRDNNGNYRNFVSETINAFINAGCKLYNDAILITAVASLPIRAAYQFPLSRKLGKGHQNVLIFVKGDWREAVKACGHVDVSVPDGFGESN